MIKIVVPLLVSFLCLNQVSHQSIHHWKLIANKHWQIVDSINSSTFNFDLSNGLCPTNMLHIKGLMKQDIDPNPYGSGTIESLQKTTCTKWINKNFPERCAEFDRAKWLQISFKLDVKPLNFCIDQYEYPNQIGQYPMIYINFNEAKQLCQAENKRLCTETEWTFSCEGEETMPYPTGYVRPSDICNIDKQWIAYRASGLLPRENASNELDRLWQGEPSGSRPNCKSSYGVYDLIGNIDEITIADRPSKFQLVLKGGYWGPVRTRCRPSTRSHDENHIFYQEGFRCCSNVKY